MVNIQAIIIANGAAILMLLTLLFSSKKTIQNRLPDNMMFYIMVGTTIMQCVIETATFLIDGKSGSYIHTLAHVLNSLSYINNIFFAFVWTTYADYKLFGDIKRIKKYYPWIAIPAVLIIIGGIINMFIPVYFTINDQNVYQRTGLFIITYIISYLYLAYGVVLIYRNRKKGDRYLFLPAILFMVPIIIGSLTQFFVYGISILWLSVAIALVSIYINVQNEVTFTDPLSGIFTRQYLNRYLDSETRRAGQKKKLAGIMLDIDRFKSINDQFGHLTGDDAIRCAGGILRSCVGSKGFVARFAGDEFVIILLVSDEVEIKDMIQLVQARTSEFNTAGKKPFSLCFSMGYSVFDRQDDTVDHFLNRMDQAMYNDKNSKQYKHNA